METPFPPLQRGFAHVNGLSVIRSWQNGEARLVLEQGRLVLEAPITGIQAFSHLEIRSGYAQERIERLFGVDVSEEVARELSATHLA